MSMYTGGKSGDTGKFEISNAAVLNEAYTQRDVVYAPEFKEAVFERVSWKRLIDIAMSVIALILLAPVLLFAAIAVKLSSPGPIVYCQERVGINRRLRDRRLSSRRGPRDDRRDRDRRILVHHGRPFMMYKFRSMVVDAEHGNPVWAKKNDSRITRVGAIMRRTRIDELPQFINVIKGDMSIVGPRPERAYFITQIEKDLPEFQRRLRTKPGITGLAQVEVGYTNTIEGMQEKLDFDLRYIRNLKPLQDLRILAKTVSVVVTGKGAC
jgi:lipopolysaccharide/colanic/teichoic acid biosynthesis glycosyltransferase